MTAAQNFVGDFGTWSNIANYDLFAFGNHDTTNCSCIMSGTRTTPT
jgi:hypothetical protein